MYSVLNYGELNEHVDIFPASVDVCAHKLKKITTARGENIPVGFKKCVITGAQRHMAHSDCAPDGIGILPRLNSVLNVASLIMRSIIDTVLSEDDSVRSSFTLMQA